MRVFVLLLALAPALNATDFKIVTVWYQDVGQMVDNGGQPVRGPGEYTYTEYVKGPWRRSDVPAHGVVPHMGNIDNCEKHEFYDINFDSREYQRGKLSSFPSEDRWRAYVTAHPRTSPIASGDLEFDTVDTGETATMFGYPAHHLITTIKIPPNEDAKRQGWAQAVVDAWYIPLQVPSTDCMPTYMGSDIRRMLTSLDIRPELRHTGPVPIRTRREGHNQVSDAFCIAKRSRVAMGDDVRVGCHRAIGGAARPRAVPGATRFQEGRQSIPSLVSVRILSERADFACSTSDLYNGSFLI